MRRLFLYSMVAVLAIGVSIGAIWAYFTSQDKLENQIITAGTLAIDMSEDLNQSPDSNWLPGEERYISWNVTNIGNVPVYLKGKLSSQFDNSALNGEMIKMTKIERNSGGTWQTISENNLGILTEYFYSPTGQDTNLSMLLPGQSLLLRATLMLHSEVDDKYQNNPVTVVLYMAARQITTGATWPSWNN